MLRAGQEYDVIVVGPEVDAGRIDALEQIFAQHQHQLSDIRIVDNVGHMAIHEDWVNDYDRSAIMDAAEALQLDVFMLMRKRPKPRLFAFDMDSTLIQAEIIDELASLAGVKDRVSAITERAMRGEIDFRGALAERLALLKGIPESRLTELTERILLSEGLESLMRGLKDAGVRTAILSGGFGFFARYLQQRLEFDHVVCNELEVKDGMLSGGVAADIVDATRKAAALQQIAAEYNIKLEECVVVGDGANDLPMIQLAGIGVAYRAKPKVKAAARYRLSFANLDALMHLL